MFVPLRSSLYKQVDYFHLFNLFNIMNYAAILDLYICVVKKLSKIISVKHTAKYEYVSTVKKSKKKALNYKILYMCTDFCLRH